VFVFTLGDFLLAAMETTSTTLKWFLVYMIRHPEIQRKLSEEVQSITGKSSRPIALSDRPTCRYTEALINEILRHSTALPISIFHRAMEDVADFHGYQIPKDTLIIANLFAAHKDPDFWTEPEEFRPERFLSKSKSNANDKNSDHDNDKESSASSSSSGLSSFLPFSAGKRNCIGESIARDQLFLFIANIVQRFEISSSGGKIPTLEGTPAVVWVPKPFEVVFTQRSK
jgi:cytochrome P450